MDNVDVLEWFSDTTLDMISTEGAQGKLNLSVLPAAGGQTVMLGVVDVGVNQVKSATSLVDRELEALRYLPREQLILAPDCGMLQLSRTAARQKLINLARVARVISG